VVKLAERHVRQGFVAPRRRAKHPAGPGSTFIPDSRPWSGMRVNIAYIGDPRFADFISKMNSQ